jgi:hypothetical protein
MGLRRRSYENSSIKTLLLPELLTRVVPTSLGIARFKSCSLCREDILIVLYNRK